MAICKCKMCGGDLEITENDSIFTCEYCGTKQTVPTAKDEALQGLFNRANVLRMKSEFDKAASLYEKIVQNAPEEAEAYWGLILCKYGIEYVEDPATYKRIPTCHRTSYDSIIADEDYKAALQYADLSQHALYEAEAKEIDRLQKEILALSQKEEPYDVFICYKETGTDGKRTPDSVIANDIYHQLTAEGFKVFYAAISLEDKLGSAYEPCIFAALNSAKVMLAIGTKPEYFNAVWVKNEWSRFLKMMKQDRSKLLIPCYKDMDAYELPEEFAHLQAQDMGKIGFINDVIRGIKKVIVKEDPKPAAVKETVVVSAAGNTAEPMVKRGYLALEDREWENADHFFEEALNLDPENGDAYLGKFLAAQKERNLDSVIRLRTEAAKRMQPKTVSLKKDYASVLEEKAQPYVIKKYFELSNAISVLSKDVNWTYPSAVDPLKEQIEKDKRFFETDKMLQRAVRFGKQDVAASLNEYYQLMEQHRSQAEADAKNAEANARAAIERLLAENEKIAAERYATAKKEAEEDNAMREAARAEAEKTRLAKIEAEKKAKEEAYAAVLAEAEKAQTAADCDAVLKKLQEYKDYKDSADRVKALETKREQLVKKEKKAKTVKTAVGAAIAAVVVAAFVIFVTVIYPNLNYNNAVKLLDEGKYEEAVSAFEALNGAKDSAEKLREAKIGLANTKLENGEYDAAVALLEELGETGLLQNAEYEHALQLLEAGDTENAKTILGKLKGTESIDKKRYEQASAYLEEDRIEEAYFLLQGLADHDSKALFESTAEKYNQLQLQKLEPGDIVNFGAYKLTNDPVKQAIPWYVLAKEDNKLLLLSKYALAAHTYHDTKTAVTWETCSLRRWLNEDFFNAAFDEKTQAKILSARVTADANPYFDTPQGNDVTDRIFLLSVKELQTYQAAVTSMKAGDWICAPTKYASQNGVSANLDRCFWWLRTMGKTNTDVNFVGMDGGTSNQAYGSVIHTDFGVRPAMWISIAD